MRNCRTGAEYCSSPIHVSGRRVAAAPKKSKALVYTMVFVFAALGIGAAVAKFAFSMF